VADQAHGGVSPGRASAPSLAICALLALGGCVGGGGNEGLGTFWDNATGRAMERRGLPPRLDQPYPNLSQVPPRPARPDVAARNAVTQELQAERRGMDVPVVAGLTIQTPPAGAGSDVPLAPPGPASLRPAPRIGETPLLQMPASVPVPIPARPPAPDLPVRGLPVDPGATPPALLVLPPARFMPADPGSMPPPPPSVR